MIETTSFRVGATGATSNTMAASWTAVTRAGTIGLILAPSSLIPSEHRPDNRRELLRVKQFTKPRRRLPGVRRPRSST